MESPIRLSFDSLFRVVFVGSIVFAGAQALLSADAIAMNNILRVGLFMHWRPPRSSRRSPLLWRRNERAAAIALVLVFAIGTALDARAGDIPVRYAYYAATALFIVFLSRKTDGAGVTSVV